MYLCEICVFFSEKVYKKCRFSFFKKLPAMFVRMLDANFKNTQQTPKSKEFLIFLYTYWIVWSVLKTEEFENQLYIYLE